MTITALSEQSDMTRRAVHWSSDHGHMRPDRRPDSNWINAGINCHCWDTYSRCCMSETAVIPDVKLGIRHDADRFAHRRSANQGCDVRRIEIIDDVPSM